MLPSGSAITVHGTAAPRPASAVVAPSPFKRSTNSA